MSTDEIKKAARVFAELHDTFEAYASKPDTVIGGGEWQRLWSAMYDARETLCRLALVRHSRFKPPFFGPSIEERMEAITRSKRKRTRLRVLRGGKP